MSVELFPHQEKGIKHLTAETGTKGLFFGMGTGKTLTAIYAVRTLGGTQVLVVGPPIALPMWVRECTDHMKDMPGGAPYDAKVQLLKSAKTEIDPDADVLVCSYDIARKKQAELCVWADRYSTVLIADEGHALKNATAKRTRAILGSGGIASFCDYTWILTGTPITRWNDDVYPFLCRADLAGLRKRCGGDSLFRFKLRYTIQQERRFRPNSRPVQMVVGNRNTDDLASWLYEGGHALRVDLQEVFDSMPPLTTNRYEVKLDKAAMGTEAIARLKELEKKDLSDIRKAAEANEPALATVRREMGMGMVKGAVAEIQERIESGQSVLVGAWHKDVIDELHHQLAYKHSRKVQRIDGRSNSDQRESAEEHWNAGNLDALVCNIAAAGVALNLQRGGNQIIVVEEDWSPSIMDQFYARLWRYGQEKPVHVDILTNETKLARALGSISGTKRREHHKFNEIGQVLA